MELSSSAQFLSRMERLDFFIAGVQKGGTTALDRMFRGQERVQMARQKEIHFFDNDSIGWSCPPYGSLHSHFEWEQTGQLRGEATPIYTYWPNSLERIAAYNRAAKIIICLRHPAYRAHSQWRMEVKRNAETLSFAEAIRTGRKRISASPGGVHRLFSYVERGFYEPQIRRAVCLFGRENVFVMRSDRLWADPEGELPKLLNWLGVQTAVPVQVDYVVPVDTSDMSPIARSDLEHLNALYGDDLAATARLTGLDLDDWLSPGYQERIGPKARVD